MADNKRKQSDPKNCQEKKKVKYVPGKLLQKPIPDILIWSRFSKINILLWANFLRIKMMPLNSKGV